MDLSSNQSSKVRNDTLKIVFNEEFFKNLQLNAISNLNQIINKTKINNARNLNILLPAELGKIKMNLTNISIPIINMSDDCQLVKFVNTDES